MFYARYVLAELSRRRGRTVVTAVGLAVGVGLVVTVTALSRGLDRAQEQVLRPLTGVGTDMSVARPLRRSGSGSAATFRPGPPGLGLSSKEQAELRKENGGASLRIDRQGKPGSHFDTTNFIATSQLSFPQAEAAKVASLAGVKEVAPALTLTAIHVSGTVPKTRQASGGALGGGPPGGLDAGAPRQRVDFQPMTVSGVDASKPEVALVTPGQIVSGHYLARAKRPHQAIVSQSYARQHRLAVGDRIRLKGESFRVVGVAKPPLGGSASDVYVALSTLQRLSGRVGRVNVLQARASAAGDVERLSRTIERSFAGSQVTTARDLAKRVGGSLLDAKNLSSKLGTALAIVALVAAFLIASLLTLSGVNKRTRELGTLKAIGWPQWLVVRQVTSESLAQGVLGGALGALVGIGGAAIVSSLGATLEATVASQARGPGPFGQGAVTSGSSTVTLHAPVDAGLLLLAVALAVLGGLIAGVVGGTRAARLRPADALRNIE